MIVIDHLQTPRKGLLFLCFPKIYSFKIHDRDRDIQKSRDKFEPLIEESRAKAETRLEEVERRVPVLKDRAKTKKEQRIKAVDEWLVKANEQNEDARSNHFLG